jgi:hypothetical protein
VTTSKVTSVPSLKSTTNAATCSSISFCL